MNLNKVKKIAVKFPNFVNPEMIIGDATRVVMKFKEARNINLEMASELFAGDSGMQVGARNLPHIEGFNCTFLNDIQIPGMFAMQFTFASGEEKKVQRIIDRYGGKLLPIRTDLNQWGTSEGDEDNPRNHFERVNETIQCQERDQYNGNNTIPEHNICFK